MKANEIIEKKFKKYSANQLLSKLEKGNVTSVEKEVVIEILEKRGQDVSKFKSEPKPEKVESKVEKKEVEKPKKTKLDLVSEVDEFVDSLIEQKRTGVYIEVMKSLGGTFESDLDDLFEETTIEQLKEALSFKNIKSKKSDTSEVKSVKKIVEPKKKVQKEEGNKKLLESKTIEKFSDSDDFSVGSKVSFEINGKSKIGTIARIFIHHKTNKEQCRIKGDDKKVYFKTVKSIKLTK